jgi:N-carbamoyl-L-amino-acid hydrolase
MEINLERLKQDITETATFGKSESKRGRGRTTLTATEADRRARDYLVNRLESAGLSVRIDPVGNIAGRWTPDSVDATAKPVAAGSHLDSVPRGGIFDGPLGVYGALEAVRSIQEAGVNVARPLEVVSFTEEEGARFKNGLLGSSVATNIRSADSALKLEDNTGAALREELANIGYNGTETIDASDWDSWAEIHIEQDTYLEEAETDVGVIEAIAGLTNCRIKCVGTTDHAGATSMDDRCDPLPAASELVLRLEQIVNSTVDQKSPTAVGTIGEMDVSPNTKNVIPGEIEMIADIRDVQRESIDQIVDYLQGSIREIESERNVSFSFDQYRYTPPRTMSERCVRTAESAAHEQDIICTRMHSPALHDTANVATVTDSVMLFAPSVDGISHSPMEWTDWNDCSTATRVLAETLHRLAS